MALTSQSTLRDYLLRTLADETVNGTLRSNILDAMQRDHGHLWTDEDRLSPAKRPFETKWQNRVSFERADMVREGLLRSDAGGTWTLTDTGRRLAAATSSAPSSAGDQGEMASGSAVAARVGLERNSTSDFTRLGVEDIEAERREGLLVGDFAIYLVSLGHEVGRFRISPGDSDAHLFTDIMDFTDRTLIEAKADPSRQSIRMAVGQLLDYRRYLRDEVDRLAVLTSSRPTADLLEFTASLGIECWYRSADGIFACDRLIPRPRA